MSSIWRESEGDWDLLAPTGFPDEASLHALIAESPHVLPLSGSPRVVVVGSKVQLGANEADVIAVEPSGRLVLIEVKLAKNSEARRAVVGQILSYAAFLRGLTAERLEQTVLAQHLRQRSFETLASAAAEVDQEGSFEVQHFYAGLEESLASGSFRLVLVLDDAPDELIRLIGYLEEIGQKLVIDLVTVANYEVDGSRLLVPQRVDPLRSPLEATNAPPSAPAGESAEGAALFLERIGTSPPEHQAMLLRLANWAVEVEAERLAQLRTSISPGRSVLLVWIRGEQRGLVTIWNDTNGPSLQLWRSVFEKKAPSSIESVEKCIAPLAIGQGNATRDFSDELLVALTHAYREAVPAPVGSFDWSRAYEAVQAIPDGRWTSYGDIAQLVGTGAQAVGNWVMSSKAPPRAYRVLGSGGEVRPGFKWNDPDDHRDVRGVLAAEGVRFDSEGRASQDQRMTSEDFKRLLQHPTTEPS
jgi:alkylated DNA nucleotide flippase Atl1